MNLKEACDMVETSLRMMGKSITLNIFPEGVELADDSWAGSICEESLWAAIENYRNREYEKD